MGFSAIRAVILIVVLIGLVLAVTKLNLPGWILPLGLVLTAGLLKAAEQKAFAQPRITTMRLNVAPRRLPTDSIFMPKLVLSILLCLVIGLPTPATDKEDSAADAVAAAFIQARQAAHLSNLGRMGRNTFRQQVCKQDMRLPSGEIDDIAYRTFDPAQLPKSARRLASSPDAYKTAARFGIGVCLLGTGSAGQPKYTVFIATYESRWTSFWRVF